MGLIALAAVVLTGCDDRAPGPEGAQPAPDTEEFTPSVLDELPRPPRSEEVAPTSVEDDVVARSLLARNTAPRGAVDFYVKRLIAWELVEGPVEAGSGTVWADWTGDVDATEKRLRVTATSSTPAAGEGQPAPEETDVQIDILLYPDAERRPPPG